MTGFAGDPFTAREQLLMLVPAVERVLGLDHLDTLRARASLAHWTGAAGDPAGAAHQFGLLSSVAERVFGNLPHPETVRMQAAAVPWYGKAGDPHTARNRAGLLLQPYLARVLGLAHPDTLGVRREQARWTGLDGDPAAARGRAQRAAARDGEHPGSRAPAHGRRAQGPSVLDRESRRMTSDPTPDPSGMEKANGISRMDNRRTGA